MKENLPYEQLRKVTGNCLRPGGLELTERGMELCAFAPGDRVLDIGCGSGATLEFLRASRLTALGLDISPNLAVEASALGLVLCGDFSRLPLADACLDGIVCECVLSLASDKALFLQECHRVLKKNGRILCSDLFRRGNPGLETARSGLCAEEVLSFQGYADLLRTGGFALLHEEDHSLLLRNLAARLIWEFGTAEGFFHSQSAASEPGSCKKEKNTACSDPLYGKSLGYLLLIAAKTSFEER